MAVQTSIASAVTKMQMSTPDKRALLVILNGMADDLETLRAQNAALLAKLDAAGASVASLGTNYTTTLAVPKASMSVKKS